MSDSYFHFFIPFYNSTPRPDTLLTKPSPLHRSDPRPVPSTMAAPLPQSQPPTLMDELVEEILLRLPSDEAAQLVCAALVCKHWCRLVTDPGFRCRFRQFLRTPSRLGLIIRRLSPATTTPPSFPPLPPSCLMPATTLSLPWTLGMAIPSSTTTPSGVTLQGTGSTFGLWPPMRCTSSGSLALSRPIGTLLCSMEHRAATTWNAHQMVPSQWFWWEDMCSACSLMLTSTHRRPMSGANQPILRILVMFSNIALTVPLLRTHSTSP